MESFEIIYRTHAEGIYRFLYKLSHDSALSEELTQETFLRALNSFGRYNGKCELFTWLCAIAKNVYFSHLRHDKKAAFFRADPEELLDEMPSPLPDPDTTLCRAEREKELQSALSRLPKRMRDVVLLRIYAELKFSQIAAYLGISESSAKVLFFRAKNKLKEDLSHVCL